jgi:hypothetical protein
MNDIILNEDINNIILNKDIINNRLFNSSIIMAIAHYTGLFIFNPYEPILVFTYIVGSITSILNHYFNKNEITHEGFMHLDRVFMVIGFFVDLYFIRIIYLTSKNRQIAKLIVILLIVCTLIYFFSLQYKDNANYIGYTMHQFIHIVVTITHLLMLKELNMINSCCKK